MSGADTDAKSGARAELWRRFDAGALGQAELDARLRLVDRAADDAAATAAVDGPVPLGRRLPVRPILVGFGVLAVLALVGAGVLVLVGGRDGGDDLGTGTGTGGGTGVAVPGGAPGDPGVVTIIAEPPPGVIVEPRPLEPPPCDGLLELEALGAETGADPSIQPTNAGPFAEPLYVPEGYEAGDVFDVIPGADGDIAFATAAGNPLPVEIFGRELRGELAVRMRMFVHDSFESALEAGADGPRTAVCDFGARIVTSDEHPEVIALALADAPIPPTAFAAWHQGDRRLSVAVEAASTDDDDLDAAAALAIEIAAAELDAAIGGSQAGPDTTIPG